ncbi:MAG TPA: sulfate transporter [Chloroflexi bacterium]|nr:sulfate transporter [Chloroflexota bacterium]
MAFISVPTAAINRVGSKTISFFLRPVHVLKNYHRSNLRPDLIAGLTVAVVLLPQAVAFSLVAELPPQMGLYAAIIAGIVGGLWGSSVHLHTGPTNAISLLVLATLLPLASIGSEKFILAAGLMAVMVGIFQIALGVARLGVLVNFVSDSVIIGYTAGAGILIGVNQLRNLLRLDIPSSSSLVTTLHDLATHLSQTHWPSLLIGLAAIFLLILQKRFLPKWPGPLIVMILNAALVGLAGLDQRGIEIIGEIPRSLPPLAHLPLLDFHLMVDLSSGALAIGAIGLVQSMAIARSLASQSRQRLDSNQEFVGQGLANLLCGAFSGFSVCGSLSRSAINYEMKARSPLANAFSGIFVLIAMFLLSPYAAYVPRTVLAGVLIVISLAMVDKTEIMRILRGTRGDAIIMIGSFFSTLFLPLQFAVLVGILLSFAVYVMRTSVPRVISVLPSKGFRHFTHQPDRDPCPQLGIFDILGDLYFGAVNHVDDALRDHMDSHPNQRFLLLRMFSVNQIDISGVHALEAIVDSYRQRGGDVFLMRTHEPIVERLKSTAFYDYLGQDHFLSYNVAIDYLFHHVLDPTICIYECEARVFLECQNLPRPQKHPHEITLPLTMPAGKVPGLDPLELWYELRKPEHPLIIDVREPREFRQGHIPEAQSIPLMKLFGDISQVPKDRPVVFVCRGGRRSTRATYALSRQGFDNVRVLVGGMQAWETIGLLEAIDQ